jgi:endonuclease/exonuclease/phosphatase family metal-dependent hydrolase
MKHRVATFNIHHGEGLDGRVDMKRIAVTIRKAEAQLIALQELDRNIERSGNADQPAQLAAYLDATVHFFPTLERAGGEYGIGLCCTDRIDPNFVAFPVVGGEEPRGAVTAQWAGLSVIGTHLSPEPGARAAQMEVLVELIHEMPPPVILLGDLNCPRWGLGPLGAAGMRAASGFRRTTARGWPRQIDYILAGPGAKLGRTFTLRDGVSDHHLLAGDTEF